jgi:hypothetical protein
MVISFVTPELLARCFSPSGIAAVRDTNWFFGMTAAAVDDSRVVTHSGIPLIHLSDQGEYAGNSYRGCQRW